MNWLGSNAGYQHWNEGWDDGHQYGGSDWASWNPQHHKDNGGSYGAWHKQFSQWMKDHQSQWENDWDQHENNNHHDGNNGNHYGWSKHDENKHDNKHGEYQHHGQVDQASYHDDSWKDDGHHEDESWNDGHHEDEWKDDGHDYSGHDENYGHEYGGHGSDYGHHDSSTNVEYTNEEEYTVENTTDVTVENDVEQSAVSGDASSGHHTYGGHVESGAVDNESNNDFTVHVDNTVDLAGLNSGLVAHELANAEHTNCATHTNVDYSNAVSYVVYNDTDITVYNTVVQNAVSGDATSKYAKGGAVTSGAAANVSNNSFAVAVKN